MNSSLFFDSSDLFSSFIRPRERVYVVSDSQYAEVQLEARAADYQRNLDVVQATITELKTEHGLLAPAKEEATAK